MRTIALMLVLLVVAGSNPASLLAGILGCVQCAAKALMGV
jgi:hypothetical protein